MAHHVFISHSTKDKDKANAICAAFEAEGISCWIAPRDIKPGEEWPVAIVKAVKRSKAMVLVFSKNADHSNDVAKETLMAINLKIAIFPFKIEEHEPTGRMQYYLTGHKWHDATDIPVIEKVKQIIEDINILIPEEESSVEENIQVENEHETETPSNDLQVRTSLLSLKYNRKIIFPLIGIVILLLAGFIYYLFGFLNEKPVIKSIHAGGNQTFVILENGKLYSFGSNFNGQLGTGDKENSFFPILVEGVGSVYNLSAGDQHTLLLVDDGRIFAFGNNKFGQLGLEGNEDRLNPTEIAGLNNGVSLAAGEKHSLVLLDNNGLYSFGFRVGGQLGHSGLNINLVGRQTGSALSLPNKVENLSGQVITKIAAGNEFTLVLTDNGDVYSFGRNPHGQLGHNDVEDQMEPKKIDYLSEAVDIAAGTYHSLVLLGNGELYSFGKGREGQLGHGDRENQVIPKKVAGISAISAIAAGKGHSLALSADGHVYSFGNNNYGNLGHGDLEDRLVPTMIDDFENVKAVVAGNYHSLLLTDEEKVFSFGSNQYGQLGLGDQENLSSPTLINIEWRIE